jgi:hypothetical protein
MTHLKITLTSALLAAVVTLSLALPSGCFDAQADRPGPEPALDLPQRVGGGMATSALGINEAVSYPSRIEARMGVASAQKLGADAKAARDLGATWTRGHTTAYPSLSYDRWLQEGGSWDRADRWVKAVQGAGLKAAAMISPFPGNRTRQHTSTYEIRDIDGYQAFVRQAVERYDGDGIRDMPGLAAPIKHWEIDNEPDLKNLSDVRTQRTDNFGTAAQFARVVVITAQAIRSADPTAIISAGGIATPHSSVSYAYMKKLYRQPGVLDAIDVVSVHSYFEGPDLTKLDLAINRIKEVAPGKPIWLTEVSVPSSGKPWATEQWQAAMVPVTYLHALTQGVEKIFWHTLFDPPPQGARGMHAAFLTNSLYARTSSQSLRLKPSGAAYKALARRLRGVPVSAISEVRAQGGKAWAVGNWWVVWGSGAVSLSASATKAETFTQATPVKLTQSGGRVTVNAGSAGGLVVLTR